MLFSAFRPAVVDERKANILLLMASKTRLFPFSLRSQAFRLTTPRRQAVPRYLKTEPLIPRLFATFTALRIAPFLGRPESGIREQVNNLTLPCPSKLIVFQVFTPMDSHVNVRSCSETGRRSVRTSAARADIF
jgi:hypothetical protein